MARERGGGSLRGEGAPGHSSRSAPSGARASGAPEHSGIPFLGPGCLAPQPCTFYTPGVLFQMRTPDGSLRLLPFALALSILPLLPPIPTPPAHPRRLAVRAGPAAGARPQLPHKGGGP